MYFVICIFLCGSIYAQNTPLGTPAVQNPDGTTSVPGTPEACASGFTIYT